MKTFLILLCAMIMTGCASHGAIMSDDDYLHLPEKERATYEKQREDAAVTLSKKRVNAYKRGELVEVMYKDTGYRAIWNKPASTVDVYRQDGGTRATDLTIRPFASYAVDRLTGDLLLDAQKRPIKVQDGAYSEQAVSRMVIDGFFGVVQAGANGLFGALVQCADGCGGSGAGVLLNTATYVLTDIATNVDGGCVAGCPTTKPGSTGARDQK